MQAAKLLNETAQQQLLESCVRLLTLRKVVYLLIYKDLFIYLFYKNTNKKFLDFLFVFFRVAVGKQLLPVVRSGQAPSES